MPKDPTREGILKLGEETVKDRMRKIKLAKTRKFGTAATQRIYGLKQALFGNGVKIEDRRSK